MTVNTNKKIKERLKPKYLKLQRKKHCTTWLSGQPRFHFDSFGLGWDLLFKNTYLEHLKHKNQEVSDRLGGINTLAELFISLSWDKLARLIVCTWA
jgi:hypothetical protein